MVRWWAVGSLVAALTVTAVPAQAKDNVSVRAPASVAVGQVLRVSGTAAHPRSVEVDRLVGHRWRPLGKAHATGGRSYAIALRAPSRPTTWRLRVGDRRLSVPVVAKAYSITAMTSAVTAPGRIAVSGTVTPRATGVVWLQREVAGEWHDLGTAVVHADSKYLVHTTGLPGTYRLRVRKAPSMRIAAGFSQAMTVLVQAPVVVPVVSTPSPAAGNVVRAWGANTSGQLGNGTTSADTPSATPAVVPGVTGTVAVTGGDDDGYALRFDGTVQAWGDGSYGQLGNGSLDPSTSAVTVPNLSGVTAISASAESVLALKSDGTVWAWGSGDQGELGNGGTDDGNVPRQVPGLGGVTAIAAAASTAYALLADGTVRAWGDNTYGQVGDGTTTTDLSPVPVSGLSQVTAIAAGTGNGYALRSDGTVWAWGTNTYGDLGNGDPLGDDSSVPVQVVGVSGATAIAGGYQSGYAVVAGGVVMAWGNNPAGQLGNADSGIFTVTPTTMPGVTGVTSVASGGLTTLALTRDGNVLATGDNGQGQLGNGDLTVTGVLTLQPVPGLRAGAVAAALQDDYVITSG